MAKIRQFVLTCAESKEYNKTGRTVHGFAGVGYVIENVDGEPKVTALTMLDPEKVEYEIVIRK